MSFLSSYCPNISPSNLRGVWQMVNGATAGLVAKNYFEDSLADPFEWISDVVVHSYQAITGDASTNTTVITAIGLNALRLSAIAYYAYQSNSTIPLALNVIDVGLHVGNLASLASLLRERKLFGVQKEPS